MTIRVVADTHAAIWYVRNDSQLSAAAASAMEAASALGEKIGISSISFIEMTYLIERGRIPGDTLGRLIRLIGIGEPFEEIFVDRRVAAAMLSVDRKLIPDMPDRIIAATAVMIGVPLITRDRLILASGLSTIW